ncbi:hypothetical protein ACI8AF_00325 [Blastococcus sp. SYSU D00669]
MDPFDTYVRLRAQQERRAVPTATRRHVHLSDRPFVVAVYHLAGEIGAPLAIMWGTNPDPAEASFLAVAEPRNRQERFEALDRFGTALDTYLQPLWPRYESRRVVRGELIVTEMSEDAPQLVVPNAATAAWLFGVVGRFTRYLPIDGDDPVPVPVRRLGQNLTFLGQASATPGSCVALAATDILNMHFMTGQLDGEKQNLATVLGWIVPPAGLDGAEAARAAEAHPPAGPLPDPNWDADVLEDLVARYHAAPDERRRQQVHREIASAAREQLEPAWRDTWRALQVVRALPEAGRVPDRWTEDRRQWAHHSARMDRGEAWFAIRPNPLQAARNLARAERATQELEAQLALDDPAYMARAVARGDAVAGEVRAVDPSHWEIVNGRRASRPRIILQAAIPFTAPIGTQLRLAANPAVTAELVGIETRSPTEQDLIFNVVAGANVASTRGRLPAVGSRAVLSPYGGSTFLPSPLPDEVPWTHVLPEPAGADA